MLGDGYTFLSASMAGLRLRKLLNFISRVIVYLRFKSGDSYNDYKSREDICSYRNVCFAAFQLSTFVYICFHIHRSTYKANERDRNTRITVLRHFMQMSTQVQKVTPVGCDWRISIRLVCFVCRKMDVETWKTERYILLKVMTAIKSLVLCKGYEMYFFVDFLCNWAMLQSNEVTAHELHLKIEPVDWFL